MANMRTGALEDVQELAISIRETGLLHPPLVRETGEDSQPYELLAGQRRLAAMALVDDAEGEPAEWRFTLVEGISRREALAMQFAENFHQRKPEPVQFARAARLIMAEDPSLSAADVSRIVGAPVVLDAQGAAAARAPRVDRRARRARRSVVHRGRLRAPWRGQRRGDARRTPRTSWSATSTAASPRRS